MQVASYARGQRTKAVWLAEFHRPWHLRYGFDMATYMCMQTAWGAIVGELWICMFGDIGEQGKANVISATFVAYDWLVGWLYAIASIPVPIRSHPQHLSLITPIRWAE